MTEWLKVVRDGLRGVGLPGAAGDAAPLDAVIRAYQGCPDPAAFSRAVADCLADPDAAVRGQALLFFEKFPSAPGAEAVAKLPREQLAGVANPWMPGTDLEWQRLRCIGARAWLRDPRALAVAYEAALEPRMRRRWSRAGRSRSSLGSPGPIPRGWRPTPRKSFAAIRTPRRRCSSTCKAAVRTWAPSAKG